jgi:DNA-binding MarR family transcriptional regulator
VTSIYKDIYGNKITPQNIYTLELCDLDNKITMSELSKGLDLHGSAVSALVSRMEKKGLLARSYGSRDRRTVFVQLTKKGNELRKDIRQQMDLLEKAITKNLTQSDIKKLQEIIATIKANSTKTTYK